MEISLLVEKIKQMHIISREILDSIKKEASTAQHETVIIFYEEILSLAQNCVTLFMYDFPYTNGVPIIVRTMLEKCMDIALICNDDAHRLNVILEAFIEQKKSLDTQLKKYSTKENVTQITKINAELELCQTGIENYQREGASYKSMYEKCEMYNSIDQESKGNEFNQIHQYYRRLSEHTHSTFLMLIGKLSSPTPASFKKHEYLIHINFINQILLYSVTAMRKIFIDYDELMINELRKIADEISVALKEYEEEMGRATTESSKD